MLSHDPSNGAALSFGALAHATLGHEESARNWIDRAMLVDPDNLSMRYNFACALASYLGDTDEALRHLERSLANATAFHIMLVQVDTDLDPLREDARFQGIVARTLERLGIEATIDSTVIRP